jgi:hypothetical protein
MGYRTFGAQEDRWENSWYISCTYVVGQLRGQLGTGERSGEYLDRAVGRLVEQLGPVGRLGGRLGHRRTGGITYVRSRMDGVTAGVPM